MGRTGNLFAIAHWDIMPDIITTAKGIASGLPLGAIRDFQNIISPIV
jgi:4-aminobutyrate aminotransferase